MLFAALDENGWAVLIAAFFVGVLQVVREILSYLREQAKIEREKKIVAKVAQVVAKVEEVQAVLVPGQETYPPEHRG